MGEIGQESDSKSQLVSEICSISTQIVSCPHRHYYNGIQSRFIDWYRIFQVEEDAEIDVIRKRYLKLALQIHPDKNAHPKAEVAFKLVSEGYDCLNDNLKRKDFDLNRKKKYCPYCKTIPYRNLLNSARNLNALNVFGGYKYGNGDGDGDGGFRDFKERFKEEVSVIENCLRSNCGGLSKETSIFNNSPGCCLFKTRIHLNNLKETPIFNPSDYIYQGYPHFRTRIHPKSPSFRCFRMGSSLKYEQGRGKYEYPVFEIRSESIFLQKKSAFVYPNL